MGATLLSSTVGLGQNIQIENVTLVSTPQWWSVPSRAITTAPPGTHLFIRPLFFHLNPQTIRGGGQIDLYCYQNGEIGLIFNASQNEVTHIAKHITNTTAATARFCYNCLANSDRQRNYSGAMADVRREPAPDGGSHHYGLFASSQAAGHLLSTVLEQYLAVAFFDPAQPATPFRGQNDPGRSNGVVFEVSGTADASANRLFEPHGLTRVSNDEILQACRR